MTAARPSLLPARDLPEGERSWWRYLQRIWLTNTGYKLSKREAKLAAYRGRRTQRYISHKSLYRRLSVEKRRSA